MVPVFARRRNLVRPHPGRYGDQVEGTPWGQHTVTGQITPLANVKLEIPVIPSTFFCVGVNYRDHVERMAKMRGTKPSYPPPPEIGYRANKALIAHWRTS